jgi:hypothetical protein
LDKPAALFRYSPDRKGERPREHLKTFVGFLQADAYAGFERLYASDRQPAPITPVACWAHARRKLNDVYKADPNSAALDGLQMIGELYDVERQIVREPADFRRKARKLSKLKALDFFAWADDVLSKASARSPLAEALRYAVKLKPQLLTYTDGRLEIDNNPAENAAESASAGKIGFLQVPTVVVSVPQPCILCSRPPSLTTSIRRNGLPLYSTASARGIRSAGSTSCCLGTGPPRRRERAFGWIAAV